MILYTNTKVAEITHKAMVDGLDFDTALKMRLELLKGMTKVQLSEVWKKLEFNKGAYRCLYLLKKLGFKTALLSGGFTFFTDTVGEILNMDYAFANTLEFDEESKLTGNIIGPIVNGHMKERIATILAEHENIPLQNSLAIGDGANDRWMISKVGLGVAYHGKALLKGVTPHHIDNNSLDALLYFIPDIAKLNMTDSDCDHTNTIVDHSLQQMLPTYQKKKQFIPLSELLSLKYNL